MKKRAFTLVEIMMVLLISAFFLGIIYSAWSRGIFFISRGDNYIQMQRGIRLLIENLEDDFEQCIYYPDHKPTNPFYIKSKTNEVTFYRYSRKYDSAKKRPGEWKVNYKLITDENSSDFGKIVRTVYDGSSKVKTSYFGKFIKWVEFTPYKLPIGDDSITYHKFRFFIRFSVKAIANKGKDTEQKIEIVTSFDVKTPNELFKDYYFNHNDVSKRSYPSG